MTVLIFIIILGILVFVHELGHFLAAKRAGIRVDEFGIGFPPKLLSWGKGETKYSLNLIPFGGFVKIFGESPDEESTSGPDSKRSFIHKNRLIQIWVLAAGVIFNVLFAWILLISGFLTGLPMPVDESNDKYASDVSLTIVSVLTDSPAHEAGLQGGEKILAIANIENPNADNVSNFILESKEEEFNLKYQRGESVVETTLQAEEGILEEGLAIGIVMDNVGLVKFPLHKSIVEGTKMTFDLLRSITIGLGFFIADAFSGNADLSQVSGPVGIVGLVGEANELGFIYLLIFTALISLHLAVLNLIPFPALDGGRILFVIIEAIIRRPINPKVQNYVNGAGFALLILLMLVVTWSDIAKLF